MLRREAGHRPSRTGATNGDVVAPMTTNYDTDAVLPPPVAGAFASADLAVRPNADAQISGYQSRASARMVAHNAEGCAAARERAHGTGGAGRDVASTLRDPWAPLEVDGTLAASLDDFLNVLSDSTRHACLRCRFWSERYDAVTGTPVHQLLRCNGVWLCSGCALFWLDARRGEVMDFLDTHRGLGHPVKQVVVTMAEENYSPLLFSRAWKRWTQALRLRLQRAGWHVSFYRFVEAQPRRGALHAHAGFAFWPRTDGAWLAKGGARAPLTDVFPSVRGPRSVEDNYRQAAWEGGFTSAASAFQRHLLDAGFGPIYESMPVRDTRAAAGYVASDMYKVYGNPEYREYLMVEGKQVRLYQPPRSGGGWERARPRSTHATGNARLAPVKIEVDGQLMPNPEVADWEDAPHVSQIPFDEWLGDAEGALAGLADAQWQLADADVPSFKAGVVDDLTALHGGVAAYLAGSQGRHEGAVPRDQAARAKRIHRAAYRELMVGQYWPLLALRLDASIAEDLMSAHFEHRQQSRLVAQLRESMRDALVALNGTPNRPRDIRLVQAGSHLLPGLTWERKSGWALDGARLLAVDRGDALSDRRIPFRVRRYMVETWETRQLEPEWWRGSSDVFVSAMEAFLGAFDVLLAAEVELSRLADVVKERWAMFEAAASGVGFPVVSRLWVTLEWFPRWVKEGKRAGAQSVADSCGSEALPMAA